MTWKWWRIGQREGTKIFMRWLNSTGSAHRDICLSPKCDPIRTCHFTERAVRQSKWPIRRRSASLRRGQSDGKCTQQNPGQRSHCCFQFLVKRSFIPANLGCSLKISLLAFCLQHSAGGGRCQEAVARGCSCRVTSFPWVVIPESGQKEDEAHPESWDGHTARDTALIRHSAIQNNLHSVPESCHFTSWIVWNLGRNHWMFKQGPYFDYILLLEVSHIKYII